MSATKTRLNAVGWARPRPPLAITVRHAVGMGFAFGIGLYLAAWVCVIGTTVVTAMVGIDLVQFLSSLPVNH